LFEKEARSSSREEGRDISHVKIRVVLPVFLHEPPVLGWVEG